MQAPVLDVNSLTKVYDNGVRANDRVSLEVGSGQVVALLGHNGAGKTTLVNQAAGLAKPSAGSIRVAGCDPVADPVRARSLVSFMPQSHAPLTGVTPRQAIVMMARIRGASRRDAQAQARHLIETLDIGEWANTPGQRLSGGVRRLTAFCMALGTRTPLVMLDEPTNDVDPVRRRLLWREIRELAGNSEAVLIVTHNVAEAERYADRVAILESGRLIADGPPAKLRSSYSADLRLELSGSAVDILRLPPFLGPSLARSPQKMVVMVAHQDSGSAVAWAQELRQRGDIDEFALSPTSLEDVYISIVDAKQDAGPAIDTKDSDATLAS